MSPGARILLVILTVFVMLLASTVIAILFAIPLFNLSMEEILHIISFPDAAGLRILKYFQIFESVFLFLVPSILAAWLFSENAVKFLNADRKPSAIMLILVMLSLITAIPMMNALSLFNSQLNLPGWMDVIENRIKGWEESAGRLTELFLQGENGRDLAVNVIMIGVLPAFGEELLFRGVIQRLLIEWTKNRHAGVWIGAFAFSFIHFQFYGFLPRFLLGLYFGYLLVWSGSIWLPIAGHFMNNAFAVIYYQFAAGHIGETAMDRLGTGSDDHLILYLSVFVTVALVGFIFLKERRGYGLSANLS